MSEELLINVSPMESRVAILNDGVLRELYIERHNKMGLVGNIYIGTVVRVLPGMQAAFVDIGQSRTAFLHVNDMQNPRKPKETKPLQLDNPTTTVAQEKKWEETEETMVIQEQAQQSTVSSFISPVLQSPTPPSSDSAISQGFFSTQQNPSSSQLPNSLQSTTDNQTNSKLNHKLNGQFTTQTNTITKTTINNNGTLNFKQFSPKSMTNNIKSSQGEVLTLLRSDSNKFEPPQNTTVPLSTTVKPSEISNTPESNTPESNTDKPQPPFFGSSNGVENIESVQRVDIFEESGASLPDPQEIARPTFRVLTTVTETLKKQEPVSQTSPQQSFQNQNSKQQTNDSESQSQSTKVNDHSNHHSNNHSNDDSNNDTQPSNLDNEFTPPSDSFTTSKAKRKSKINPDELIQNRLREGQRVLVQVTKDQLGTKGARLTTNMSLPSRYLVYLPSSDNIGISQRIDNNAERNRLRRELASIMQRANLSGGVIARTAAEKVPTAKLEEDIYYLLQLWRTIHARKKEINSHQSSMMVYQELSLPLRSIRDHVHEGTERVVIDDANTYDSIRQFAQDFVPMIYPRIVPYHSQQPMFDVFRVEEDLRDALKRRVDLKSGGYLIIDQTEAMTTIDVNTGSYVGGRSLEDTVYKTNLEATHAIARQLRLRNLGGIIILDFIDMQEQEHKDDVLISLQTQLTDDYARTNITQISDLGLVEMTRKRTRESLEQQLCEPCATCQGKGFIKTAETVCFEIFREIMRCARTYNAPKQFTVVAHAAVIDLLLTSEADTVADLEYLLGRVITFEVETLYTQEQYDIALD